jgi:hypothetical protein
LTKRKTRLKVKNRYLNLIKTFQRMKTRKTYNNQEIMTNTKTNSITVHKRKKTKTNMVIKVIKKCKMNNRMENRK